MAVVGIQDELKGQLPCAFFVLNKAKVEEKEPNSAAKKVKSELVQMVRKEVGAVAAFKMAIAVKDIPRTRSGKTPRKVIADLASGRDFKVLVPSMRFWSVSWSTNCPVYFSLFLVDQKKIVQSQGIFGQSLNFFWSGSDFLVY